ncbi:hypothetical protein [Nannocystis pusilla]|uniref:hypothetical protein n=1 Tax=Nannocystis pusilla TaxID=889268 RepID=UPI003B7E8105
MPRIGRRSELVAPARQSPALAEMALQALRELVSGFLPRWPNRTTTSDRCSATSSGW